MEPLTPARLQEFADAEQRIRAGLAEDSSTLQDAFLRVAGPVLDGISQDKSTIAEAVQRIAQPIQKGIAQDRNKILRAVRKAATPIAEGLQEDRTLLTGAIARAAASPFRPGSQRAAAPRSGVGQGSLRSGMGAPGTGRPTRPAPAPGQPGRLRPPSLPPASIARGGGQPGGDAAANTVAGGSGDDTGTCSLGTHWDPTVQMCVADDATHQCPTGQHWDEVTQQCVDNIQPPQCPPGQHWDATRRTCVDDVILQQCPPGFHWDALAGMCVPDNGHQPPRGYVCVYCTADGTQRISIDGFPPPDPAWRFVGCYDPNQPIPRISCPPYHPPPPPNGHCNPSKVTCPPGWTVDPLTCACLPPPPPPGCDPCMAWAVTILATATINLTVGTGGIPDLCACIRDAARMLCDCLGRGYQPPPPSSNGQPGEVDPIWYDPPVLEPDFEEIEAGAYSPNLPNQDDAFAQGPPTGSAETGGFNPAIFGD